MRFLGQRMQGPQGASWEGLSAPRARNPLFRRISPLFRLQRRFSVNTLNLQQFWREELRRTRPVWRNPLFLPLLPANPAGWISPSARPSAARRALQTGLVSQPAGPLVLQRPAHRVPPSQAEPLAPRLVHLRLEQAVPTALLGERFRSGIDARLPAGGEGRALRGRFEILGPV